MPAMENRYKHLNCAERSVIFAEHQRGASARSIGRLLSRSGATISRELRRGQSPAEVLAFVQTLADGAHRA